jgi:hypothetical protein
MASIKLPAWPKGIAGNVWANKLADASVYAVESNVINYDTGTSALIFAIPDDSVVMGVGLELVSDFTGASGATKVDVTDSAGTILGSFGVSALDSPASGDFKMLSTLKRYAKTAAAGNAGARHKAIEVDVTTGGCSAGTFRIWLQLKPNRNSLRSDYVGDF